MTPANKGVRYPQEVLTRSEVERLLRAADGKTASRLGRRNRALLTLLWRTGMRSFEACALRRCDLDTEAGTIRVVRPKGFARGKRPRVLGLDTTASLALSCWLEARSRMLLGDGDPLFVTHRGGRIATSYLRTLLPRLAEIAGIDKRVHPHMLRHTFASELAMERQPLPVIMSALGHSRITTTARYIASIAPAETIGAMQERE